MQRIGFATCVMLVALWEAPVAFADVAPPDDYVEECTRALQEGDEEYCEYRSGNYADVEGCCDDDTTTVTEAQITACCSELGAQGWAYRCRTWGGSFFQVLWCRPRQQADPPRPEIVDEGEVSEGCNLTNAPAMAPAFLLSIIPALLVAFLWLRRSRRGTDG